MEFYDYLVIGGGVAGTTAAETIRERDSKAGIAIVSDEPHPLYSRVLLPNYVKGLVNRERVFLRRREDYQAKDIIFLGGVAAQRLDTTGRVLHVSGGHSLSFGRLLVATGGRPRRLGIPGEELGGVSRFQTIVDADRMLELLPATRRALVVGGSFIALEYLEILAGRGVSTTLVIPQPYFFSRFFEPAASELLHENFRRHGIEIIANQRLQAIGGGTAVESVRLADGRAIQCDFVGLGIGLERNTAWSGSSNLKLSSAGIITDEFLETPVVGIFAAGDAADFYDLTLQFRHTHGNWGNSFRQGELAGRNMADPASREPYRSVTSYGIRNLGLSIALVGHVFGGPRITTVSRLDPAGPSYGRFFFSGQRLVGAALINRHEDRSAITTLIRDAVPFSAAMRGSLVKPTFDIASLAAHS